MSFIRKIPIRSLALLSSTIGGIYLIDDKYNARTLQRNSLTIWNGICIGLDYKINFRPEKGDKIDDLHERVAQRILRVCKFNGGLYIKLGQAIQVQSAILPAAYQRTFKTMYDEAPAVDFDQVAKIFQADFKCHPDDMFDDFERVSVASASVAQVHRAKLKDGTPVAVKVQKPNIKKQMNWDLMAYKALMYAYEYLFDLPLTWTAETQDKHLREEVDFINEGKNSERTKRDLEQIRSLKDKVYIPKVFWDYTSSRVLTCEWIDGVRVTDKEGLARQLHDVMKTTIDIFASQIFVTGFVHADPHPGNVFVRPHPNKSKKYYQIVLIDHGLYVEESVVFRHQYSLFWKSLFLMDTETINEICQEWGINDPEMFASATLMKPYNPKTALHIATNQKFSLKDAYEMQMALKERIKKFLSNTELIPRELIFVGRNMNIVRSLNRELGSPVNRINIMGNWAVKGLGSDWTNWGGNAKTFNEKQQQLLGKEGSLMGFFSQLSFVLQSRFNYWLFRGTLLFISIGFYLTKVRESIEIWINGRDGNSRGFEDVLDDRMKQTIEEKFGVVLDQKVFEG
ncbi:ABC1-domain-containing protein [Rhizophagus irregularis]|uniref:ABC1-domain-containing protein n=1 Tax=Rhizophagus irregularis TaxID=588596 RepID=A0A2N1NMQ4_9GLOM|nr:ABC1-domain-containing protein [Rhizophagus irregularis]